MNDPIECRRTIVRTIRSVCDQYDRWHTLDESIKKRISTDIEKGCFKKTISYCESKCIPRKFSNNTFVELYSSYCYRIITNLDINGAVGDHYLLDRLIENPEISINLVNYTDEELSPNASKAERDLIEKRKHQKNNQKVSTAYTCSKCNNKSTIHCEMQLRAADESCTYRIQCTVCYNSWYM